MPKLTVRAPERAPLPHQRLTTVSHPGDSDPDANEALRRVRATAGGAR
ncbi:hypothetical protein [Streptomyces sp. NPDC059979]